MLATLPILVACNSSGSTEDALSVRSSESEGELEETETPTLPADDSSSPTAEQEPNQGDTENAANGENESTNVGGTASDIFFSGAIGDDSSQNCSTGLLNGTRYGFWLAELGMINVLEISNLSDASRSGSVRLIGEAASSSQNTLSVALLAGEKREILLNDLPGYAVGKVGVLEARFLEDVDVRTYYYQLPIEDSDNRMSPIVGHAFQLALEPPRCGSIAANFNTFQPSSHPEEVGIPIEKELILLNLSANRRTYRIRTFDELGVEIDTSDIESRPMTAQRIRAKANSEQRTGVHLIQPQNGATPHLVYVARLGTKNLHGLHSFRLVSSAQRGSSGTQQLAIARPRYSTNWLELINPTARSVVARIQIYDDVGTQSVDYSVELPPRTQHHMDASAYLSDEGTGRAQLTTAGPADPVIAHSIVYYHDPLTGRLNSADLLRPQRVDATSLSGSYNSTFETAAWLRLLSAASEKLVVDVRIGETTINAEIPPFGTTSLPLHQLTPNATRSSAIHISATEGSAGLAANIIRMGESAPGVVEWIVSNPLIGDK